MKRFVFLLVLTGVVALGQEQPAPATPNLEPWQVQALKNALRGSHLWFEPVPAGMVQPELAGIVNQEPRFCAVPLLLALVDPTVDAGMPIAKPPKKNIDNMPLAEGLPPCPRDDRLK
jgi:hypothetical protein